MSLSIIKYPISGGGGGGTITGASNGVSSDGTSIFLGQDIGQVGNPATLLSDREIPLNGNDLIINGDSAIKYSFQPFFFSIGDLPDRNAQFSARAASFVNLDPVGTALVSVSRGSASLQMVINGTSVGGDAELHATTLLHVGTLNNSDLNIITNNLERITVLGSNGNVGIKTINPTAQLHLPAGTAAAGTAQIKLAPSVLMTTPEIGAIENAGDLLYHTISTGTARKILTSIPTASLVVDRVAFYSAAGLESSSLFRFSTSSTSLSIGGTPSSSAYLVLGAGSTTRAPLRITSGTNMTTAIAGSFEYDGVSMFFTPSGTDRRPVSLDGRNAQSGTTYTVLNTDQGKIIGLSNTGVRTVTLLAASAVQAGVIIWFKDEAGTAGASNVTINRAGADTIDGGTSTILDQNFQVKGLYSNGSNAWFVI